MRNIMRLMTVIILIGSTVGVALGATITLNKIIDVPDRDFKVTYQDSTFNFTIDNLGNYKFGDSIGVTVNGGVNRMRLVIWSVDKLSTWSGSFENPGGAISTTIPADLFDPSCPGVCDNNKMGPGIYAFTVQDMVNGPPYNYITAKPFIISEYDMLVTPDKNRVEQGNSIKVIVNISKSGSLVDVSNNVKVEFVQDSKTNSFGAYATKVSTGTYEANIQIPETATGSYSLYAAITTNKNIYQDYPEIIGAASYNGENIQITNSASTPTTSTSSSGSSGGGGSGPSGEHYLNIEVKEKYELYILNDKITSYRFKNPSNPISFINITGNISAGSIITSVEVLKDTSSLVKSDASELVYKNMNIWVGTSGFAVPKNIKNALIKFRVDNSWITKNTISSNDVKMFRWDGSQWIQLETTEIENMGEYTIYEAITKSFSSFAIAAKPPEISPQIIDTNPKTTSVQTETTEPAESGEAKNIPTGIGTILAFIILCEVYLIKKKK